ncbi:hypothetical protein [Jannaschia sp. M317]|uniref:hypothetical protein n=1 Tax=Jannaschia sp. M317 TaxID=2867011 RepID=UPI0021A32E05|nr:hypothetical protein [Jannaschia sp. M317]UWQ16500.1 hypothetical protein K3551_11295 [Jannaschia sp. M317]
MKPLALALAAIIASTGAAQALDFTRISSERAFRQFVADRTLVDDFGGTLIFAGNGGIGGQRDRSRISGGWVWNEGALCHRTRIDGLEFERDCKLLYIRGNVVVMQEKRGTSSQQTWTLR